jgi:glycosyltransferase involved in cell wall biosynthesis
LKKGSNILVLTGWSRTDALVEVYTLPYVRLIRQRLPSGSRLILLTLEPLTLLKDTPRMQSLHAALQAEGIDWRPLPYRRFGPGGWITWCMNLLRVIRLARTSALRCIHAWCMPAGTLGYLASRLSGCPLVIDSYEPHAEAMVENGTWKRNGLRHRLLFYFEKRLSRHAFAVVAAVDGMRDYAARKYGVQFRHFFVKPACVDLDTFCLARRKNPELLHALALEGKRVCLYAGKFGGIYLQGAVFDFFKAAADRWGDTFRVLLLSNHPEQELRKWAQDSGLDWSFVVLRFVPSASMPDYAGLADFAITPVVPVPTKRYCTPIKDGEYWAMGLPVVITPDISDDSEIIRKHDAGCVLASMDRRAYEDALGKIDALLAPGETRRLEEKMHGIAETYRNFSIAEGVYDHLYLNLLR